MSKIGGIVALMAVSLLGCSEVAAPPPPPPPGAVPMEQIGGYAEPAEFPSNFTLIFTREYGMWKFRACTLEIGLFVKTNRATLDCDPTEGARVKATQELAAERVTRLRYLVQAADLFGPDHIGQDLTPTDGIFETLRFRPSGGGRAAVLVTSGNRSFVDRDARRELLQLLSEIETALSKDSGLLTR